VEDFTDMGSTNGSPAARRQVGLLLKKLRDESGKSIQDVREAKIAGDTKVWRLESGKTLPSIPDVLGLCWLYGADRPTTQRLTDMVTEVSNGGGGWWEEYGESVPSWLSLNVGMEQNANRIAIFQPELVHGLLQTPDYALAVNLQGDDAKQNAELRLARQRAVFARTDSYEIDVVLGAGALARQVGGTDVMTEQVGHLRLLGREHPVKIRVLSWEIGMHDSINGPYTLFEFAGSDEDPVVYVPLLAGGRYIEKPQQIAPYQAAFSSIWSQATPIEEYTQ